LKLSIKNPKNKLQLNIWDGFRRRR